MTSAEATTNIPVAPDRLWREIGPFQSVGRWHPMLADVSGDGEQPGARRTATAQDGSRQVERLDEVDPTNRFYRYTMESSPLPVRDYTAEFRIRADDDRGSIVEWTSEFEITAHDREATRDVVRQFLVAGVEAIRQRYS